MLEGDLAKVLWALWQKGITTSQIANEWRTIFTLGRPALENVGVEFLNDVAPYETVKLRILNAGHAAIGDTIARLCQDGSNRQPKFVLPTIADALARDTGINGLALEVALWCRYCAHPKLVLDDARAEQLATAARSCKNDPMLFLRISDVFGDLATNECFSRAFARQVGLLWAQNPRQVLKGFLHSVDQ